MSFETYAHLVDAIKKPSVIKLQGTGEAMLHPEFDRFVIYAKKRGHFADIITNGSVEMSDVKIKHLDRIGFSIDTLDEVAAAKNGRKNLKKVVQNLLRSHKQAPKKCMIFSVSYGQDLKELRLLT